MPCTRLNSDKRQMMILSLIYLFVVLALYVISCRVFNMDALCLGPALELR